jgi:hypothetical protein
MRIVSLFIPKYFNLFTSNSKFSMDMLSLTLLKNPPVELLFLIGMSWDKLVKQFKKQNNKIKYLIIINKVIDLK